MFSSRYVINALICKLRLGLNKTKPRRDGAEHAGRRADGVFSQFISFSQFYELLSNLDSTGHRCDGVIASIVRSGAIPLQPIRQFSAIFLAFRADSAPRNGLAAPHHSRDFRVVVCFVLARDNQIYFCVIVLLFGLCFSGVMNGIDSKRVSQIMCNIMLSTAMMECITFSAPPRNLYASVSRMQQVHDPYALARIASFYPAFLSLRAPDSLIS